MTEEEINEALKDLASVLDKHDISIAIYEDFFGILSIGIQQKVEPYEFIFDSRWEELTVELINERLRDDDI